VYRLGILDTGRNVVDLAPRPEKSAGGTLEKSAAAVARPMRLKKQANLG
jgi:hypothetical protein